MGICGSKEQGGCVRVRLGKKKHTADRAAAAAADGETFPRFLAAHHGRRRRRRLGRKNIDNINNRYSCRSKVHPSADAIHRNPTINGSTEWFDTTTGIESDGDEDFYSTQDDIVSQSSSISASVTSSYCQTEDNSSSPGVAAELVASNPAAVENDGLVKEGSAVGDESADLDNLFKRTMPWISEDISMKDRGLSLVQWMNMQQNPSLANQIQPNNLNSSVEKAEVNHYPENCNGTDISYD